MTRKISFTWPAVGPITSYFGTGHPTGIDIGLNANEDSPIRAAAAGVVSFAGGDPCCSLGNYVEIQHADGSLTKYGHLQRVFVAAGEKVTQGATIGLGGSTGAADGKHLHFEVVSEGIVTDPLHYLPFNQNAQSGVEHVATGAVLRLDSASDLLLTLRPTVGSEATLATVSYQLDRPASGVEIALAQVGSLQAELRTSRLRGATGVSLSGQLLVSLIDTRSGVTTDLAFALSLESLPTLPNAPAAQASDHRPTLGPPTPTPTNTPVIGRLASPTPRPTLTPYAPRPTRTPYVPVVPTISRTSR